MELKLAVIGIILIPAFALSIYNGLPQTEIEDGDSLDLPRPHIIIIGATGVGKSSLANVFIGEDPGCEDCTFPVCSGADSCTKETSYAVRPWLGEGANFTVVDTPGFGDSDLEDPVLIDEMMTVLKDNVKSATVLYMVLDGREERFSASLQQMLREMRALFGDNMWDNMIVGVNKWKYSAGAIEERNQTCVWYPKDCRDEQTYSSNMMASIDEKFHVGKNLTFVFIDSFAKHQMNIHDQHQQEAFERETSILWDFAMSTNDFEFKSIQDVLEENDKLKIENAYLKNVLESNITKILEVLDEHTEDISGVRIKLGETDNTVSEHENHLKQLDTGVASNQEKLQLHNQTLAEHKLSIDANGNRISENENHISENGVKIEELVQTFSSLEKLPLGTILAWNQIGTDIYPENWIECDGREIPDGPWAGRLTPDINNAKRFLRGGTLGEAFETQEDAMKFHTHGYYDKEVYYQGVTSSGYIHYEYGHSALGNEQHRRETEDFSGSHSETRPKNIKVVFILKYMFLEN